MPKRTLRGSLFRIFGAVVIGARDTPPPVPLRSLASVLVKYCDLNQQWNC